MSLELILDMTLERLVEAYGLEWDTFAESLEDLDREAFDALLHRAKQHADAGSKVENPNLFESVVMSILVEHQQEMSGLEKRLDMVKTKTCPRCCRTSRIEEFFKGQSLEEGVGTLCLYCQEALCFGSAKREGM